MQMGGSVGKQAVICEEQNTCHPAYQAARVHCKDAGSDYRQFLSEPKHPDLRAEAMVTHPDELH